MKNKEFRTLMAIIALSGTLLTGLTAAATPVYAADVNTTTTTTAETASTVKPYKDETVYATIDGNGAVKEVTVSDQLKNISDIKSVSDKSDLQNIENVKGDETFSTNGENLTWNTNNADICYQGTSTKALPVSVKVTYTLDGTQMKAEELAGKSGHLVIRYDYENNSAEAGSAKTPFLMATGLMLDGEVFKNVEVTNGRIMSDGEKEVALGIVFPDLNDMLGTSDLDVPEYFEVSADVTDYKQAQGMTIATNSFFNDLETDAFDSLSDLQGSMNELQDASNQLVDGSGELRKGLDTLLTSSGTMKDGIKKLAEGSTTLADGTATLENGAGELAGGLNTAATKVSDTLLPGAKQLDAGVSQMRDSLNEGLPKLADGVTRLNEGVAKVADGTKALNGGIGQVADGTHALNGGINQVADGTHELNGGIGQVADGMSVLNKGIGEIAENTTKLAQGLDQAGAGVETLKVGVGDLANTTTELTNGSKQISAGATAIVNSLNGVINNLPAGASVDETSSQDEINILSDLLTTGKLDEETAGVLNQVIQSLQNDQATRSVAPSPSEELKESLTVIRDNASQLAGRAADVSNGIAAVGAQFQTGTGDQQTLADGVNQLHNVMNRETGALPNGAKRLDAVINVGDPSNKQPALKAAVARLNAAMNTGDETTPALRSAAATLDAAMNTGNGETPALKVAAETLDAAMNTGNGETPALRNAAETLDAAMNTGNGETPALRTAAEILDAAMNTGSGETPALKVATETLHNSVNGENGLTTQVTGGVAQLKDGTSRLVAGIDGSQGLASGLNQLNAGAAQLAGGSTELNTGAHTLAEGIGTLNTGSDALIDGVTKLDEGAAKLNDGMIKFDEEGIQKLVDAFSGDIEGLLDRANGVLDNSRAYKNFSGIADDMDGEVKFIFITE